jgi:hypothetical protein
VVFLPVFLPVPFFVFYTGNVALQDATPLTDPADADPGKIK